MLLIESAGADEFERARRERLLEHLRAAESVEPLALAKYSLERARTRSLGRTEGARVSDSAQV